MDRHTDNNVKPEVHDDMIIVCIYIFQTVIETINQISYFLGSLINYYLICKVGAKAVR